MALLARSPNLCRRNFFCLIFHIQEFLGSDFKNQNKAWKNEPDGPDDKKNAPNSTSNIAKGEGVEDASARPLKDADEFTAGFNSTNGET